MTLQTIIPDRTTLTQFITNDDLYDIFITAHAAHVGHGHQDRTKAGLKAVRAALGPYPEIPETVGLITLEADEGWEVEFWYFESNREEPDWESYCGDYADAKFLMASIICRTQKLTDYVAWDVYRDYQTGDWEAYVRDAEEGDPTGRGSDPIAALRAAVANTEASR